MLTIIKILKSEIFCGFRFLVHLVVQAIITQLSHCLNLRIRTPSLVLWMSVDMTLRNTAVTFSDIFDEVLDRLRSWRNGDFVSGYLFMLMAKMLIGMDAVSLGH